MKLEQASHPPRKKIYAAIKRNILSRKNDNLQVPMSIQRFIPPSSEQRRPFRITQPWV